MTPPTSGPPQSRPSDSFRPPEPNSGIPWITWVIGGAAFLVVLTAGALLLQGKKAPPDPPVAEEEEAAADSSAKGAMQLAPKNPLDITRYQLDAMERAKIWNSRAMLASIEVMVDGGEPQGPVNFNFGASIGQPMFNAPLDNQRFSIGYEGKKANTTEDEVGHVRHALTEPNCPLEVAYRKVKEAGNSLEGTVGVLLMRSEQHRRTVWMLSEASGVTHPVDADTCALLRR